MLCRKIFIINRTLILLFTTVILLCNANGFLAFAVTSSPVDVKDGKTHHFNVDTEIEVVSGYGIKAGGSNAKVTAADNVVVTISGTGNGINGAQKAQIILGETHITAKFYGIFSAQIDTTVTLGDKSSINSGYTAVLSQAGTVNLGNDVTLSTSGTTKQAHGVNVSQGGLAEIGNGAKITTGTDVSYGLAAYGNGSKVTAKGGLDIITQGASSNGVVVWDGGSITITENGTKVVTSGDDALGLFASFNGKIITGSVDVNTTGQRAHGLTSNRGNLKVGDGNKVITQGNNSSAVLSNNAEVIVGSETELKTTGDDSYGVYAFNKGTVDLAENTSVFTEGAGAFGLHAAMDNGETPLSDVPNSGDPDLWRGGTINTDNDTEIFVSGSDTIGVYALDTGEIYLNGKTTITIGEDKSSYAIVAEHKSETYERKRQTLVKGDGEMHIKGGILAGDNGVVDLKMASGSSFHGHTTIMDDGVMRGKINFDLTDSNWWMLDNSVLTSLAINDSNIYFGGDDYYFASSQSYRLDIMHLQESAGTFVMRTQIAAMQGDKVYISDTAAGDHLIYVHNSGSMSTTGREVLPLIIAAGVYDNTASFALTHVVEAGAYKYYLRRNGDIWELYSPASKPSDPQDPKPGDPQDPSKPVEPDEPDDPPDPGNPGPQEIYSNEAVGGFTTYYAVTYLLGLIENQSLHQRMGDLRRNNHAHGLWIKALGGNFQSKKRNLITRYNLDYYGFQGGYDYKFPLNDGSDGSIYAGAMLGYVKGDLNLKSKGDADVERLTMGGYATYVHPEGYYADLVVKYGWLLSDYNLRDSAGDQVKSNTMHNNVLGASLEIGKRYFIDPDENGKGWYVEPQAQLSYNHYIGGKYKSSSGMVEKFDSYDSLVGRLGFNTGLDVELNNGDTLNIYAKGSWNKELKGDIRLKVNDAEKLSEKFNEDWVSYGVGLNYQIDNQHNFYLDIERSAGAKSFRKEWGVNLGYRVTF